MRLLFGVIGFISSMKRVMDVAEAARMTGTSNNRSTRISKSGRIDSYKMNKQSNTSGIDAKRINRCFWGGFAANANPTPEKRSKAANPA